MSERPPTSPLPHAYDPALQRWLPGRRATNPRAPRKEMRVLSWNVWFGDLKRHARAVALVDEVLREDVDVVALQEVEPEWLEWLLEQPPIRERYVVSDTTGETLGDYGVVLLSRLPVLEFVLRPLPSRMERAMLAGALEFGGQTVVVATVHAESTRFFAKRRREQFKIMLDALRAQPHDALLVGDTNLGPGESIEDLSAEFVDLWAHLHPSDPGLTRDPAINVMRASIHPDSPPARLDRMFLRAPNQHLRPASMKILGTSPLPDEARIFPSDHFGLVTSFEEHAPGGSLSAP